MSKISVSFDGFCQTQRHPIGHLGYGVRCSSQEDIFQTERFDEWRPFKQQADPFQKQQSAVNVTVFKTLKQPSCRLNPALMSDDGTGHARDHGMRVPIHVLRTSIRLSVPGSRSLSQCNGFNQVIAVMNWLAVRNGCKPVDQRDAQPPSNGVGCMRVKGLGEPVRRDVEQQAMSHIIKSALQPFLMNFIRVIGQIHSMWNDEIDHRVEMTVKHTTIDVQNTQALLKQSVW